MITRSSCVRKTFVRKSRAKWEANRDKPSTVNPSRRKSDFRKIVTEFATERADKEKAFFQFPLERRFHENSVTGYKGYNIAQLDSTRSLVLKNPLDLKDALMFQHFVKTQKPKSFQLVSLKIGTKGGITAMQYIHRPSLAALISYLKGNKTMPAHELSYCARLVEQITKAGISQEQLRAKALLVKSELIRLWRKSGNQLHYDFSSANFLVCGIGKNGLPKIAIVDL